MENTNKHKMRRPIPMKMKCIACGERFETIFDYHTCDKCKGGEESIPNTNRKEDVFDLILGVMSKVVFIGIMFILSPLLIAFAFVWLLNDGFQNKCKYHKVCEYYSNQSETCTKNAGEYPVEMFEFKPASCYTRMNKRYYK